MNSIFISIVGGIAVGKTTIGNYMLDLLPDSKFIQEDVSQNEYLKDFYSDMKTWAFHSRMSTLAMISSNYIFAKENYQYVIMDRCLDELITFAELQFVNGNMTMREYNVYKTLHRNLVNLAPPIDIYIYCYCSPKISLQRIKSRNREFEQKIDFDYIMNLNSIYNQWVSSLNEKKVIKIDTGSNINFNLVKEKIEAYIVGGICVN